MILRYLQSWTKTVGTLALNIALFLVIHLPSFPSLPFSVVFLSKPCHKMLANSNINLEEWSAQWWSVKCFRFIEQECGYIYLWFDEYFTLWEQFCMTLTVLQESYTYLDF